MNKKNDNINELDFIIKKRIKYLKELEEFYAEYSKDDETLKEIRLRIHELENVLLYIKYLVQ